MKRRGIALLLSLLAAPAFADVGFYIGMEAGHGRTQLGHENDDLVLTNGILLDTSEDEKDSAFGLYGGYTFSKYFSIELSYTDLGETSFTTVRDIQLGFPVPLPFPFPFPTTPAVAFRPYSPYSPVYTSVVAGGNALVAALISQQRMTFDSEALALALLGRYDVGGGFALLGRAGLAIHRMESDIQIWTNGIPSVVVGGADKSSAGAAVLGVGADWSFHSNWALRLQVQRHFMLEEEEINLVERNDVTLMSLGVEYRF